MNVFAVSTSFDIGAMSMFVVIWEPLQVARMTTTTTTIVLLLPLLKTFACTLYDTAPDQTTRLRLLS